MSDCKGCNLETMIRAENRSEAEELAKLLSRMPEEQQRDLKIFLEGVKFWEDKPDKRTA